MLQDDMQLVIRFQNGDETAFAELADKYKKKIYYTIYYMVHNPDEALDLSQEIFIKAYKALHAFKLKSSFYTWLYRIAVNHCSTFIKKKHSRYEMSYNDALKVNELDRACISAWEDNPEKVLSNKQIQRYLQNAINALPPRQRIVFTLRYFDNLPQKEIAEILNCSVGNIKANLFKALQNLKDKLQDCI